MSSPSGKTVLGFSSRSPHLWNGLLRNRQTPPLSCRTWRHGVIKLVKMLYDVCAFVGVYVWAMPVESCSKRCLGLACILYMFALVVQSRYSYDVAGGTVVVSSHGELWRWNRTSRWNAIRTWDHVFGARIHVSSSRSLFPRWRRPVRPRILKWVQRSAVLLNFFRK